jgi:2-phospho-L-lactate guanylyltransferase
MLGSGARTALAQAMFRDVISTLHKVPGLDETAVVTADRAAASVASGVGAAVLLDTAQAGQSAAALVGIDYAITNGYDRVLLVPGDTPLLEPSEVADLISGAPPVVVVPDRHGTGTNALLLSPPDAIEPSFGPDSLSRHVAAARASEQPYRVKRVAGLALDVDTPEDLAELAAALDGRRGGAPATRGALNQLERAGAWNTGLAQAPA